MKRNFARKWGSSAISVGVIVGLILFWEIICRAMAVPSWLLPTPSAILAMTWENRDRLPRHFLATLNATLGGFILAVAAGVPIAIAITASRILRNVIYPVLLVFQSVPKVALAPLILLWVGFGLPSKIVVAAITAFFPIVINTSAGVSSVSEEMLQLTRSYNSPALRTFLKVRLPFAMPYIFSGMKIAMTLAVIGAVVGEFVGSDVGLGFIILTSSSTMNTALVFSGMMLLSIMGITLFYCIALIERVACPWYQSNDQNLR
ncbi:ABC transporter permease [Acuticoccus kandeliae]|uniref:ABC transporter permease n=1 Tax=Acuticoccus kandeliae TaxID=2073160 RepID=UPI000D3E18F7|nr:ABC transporter permease [Acuticoccus kandeliae]